ncbi:hypothetical protein NP493_1285g00036 [Ridgeia piscesae]|uniref:LIM zinc-binding domain-containing protein n=1 Tax=Ridgeia piscesae TaxID=27915 RepID=A0AAD9NEN7_RIDPI|nr:hypothetical protein NP493_1285g00036 [Ridgeia piscesae]
MVRSEHVDKADPECCPRCGKRVYFAEQMLSLGRKWHKMCFTCSQCKKKVDSQSAADHEGELYCKSCYGRQFGPRGYGFAGGAGTMMAGDATDAQRRSSDAGSDSGSRHSSMSSQASREEYVNTEDQECCPRCGKRVYFAEQILSLGRKWHKPCFRCTTCEKKLDSQSATDHQGEMFCRACHSRQFGLKGYGYAAGAGTMLSMDSGHPRRGDRESSSSSGDDRRVLSQSSREEYVNTEDQECCPRCGKRVYFAEQVLSLSRKWHKPCFTCAACNKKVDSQSAADHQGELYCRACHSRQFGLRGYGYAAGAGTMLSMDSGPPRRGDRESSSSSGDDRRVLSQSSREEYVNTEDQECCPRCGKRVYFAEQVLGIGRKFHKSCFTCGACGKKVDSQSSADHQGELYCKSCHGRKFGPKGYGFAGGAGTMLSMESDDPYSVCRENVPHIAEAHVAPTNQMRQLSVNDEEDGAVPQGVEGGCPRCGGPVYLAEERVAAGNSYHVRCFTCFLCNHKLDSNNLTENNGEIYCKSCYGKKFAPRGYGFGTGAGVLQTDT